MQNFRDLTVWQKSHALTLQIYRVTKQFPTDERFGLTSQIRRCASSIGANMAEGCGRSSSADLAHFFQMSLGSAYELENHLQLAVDLGYLSEDEHHDLTKSTIELKKMMTAFINTVRNK